MVTEQVKLGADAAAVGVAGATLIGWLPAISAIAVIIWTCVRTYTHIVDWCEKRAERQAKQRLS